MSGEPHRGARRWRLRPWPAAALGAIGLMITATTWVAFRHGVERGEAGLPILGTVPGFSLVASSGQPYSNTNLAGEIWIADFIFTQCPGVCPRLSEQMARLQNTLAR